MSKPYTVEQPADYPNVLTIRLTADRPGWEQWFLLSSDRHHDNSHADHALELKHLKQARERNAGILDFGDLFCAMQGKWDKRASQDAYREELRTGKYLDRLVEYNAAFYAPFADLFDLIAPGNHETSIIGRHETDLTKRLVDRLNRPDDKSPPNAVPGNVFTGPFAGWVNFRFTIAGNKRKTLRLYRHHGYGGGGAVTKGVIQSNRMAVYTPDATFVASGHTHDQWIVPLGRTRINDMDRPFTDLQWHIRCGGYKDEHSPMNGWWAERGGEPKPLGAVWLRFFLAEGDAHNGRVSYELTPTYSTAA